MSVKFFRCTCGKLHAVHPSAFRTEVTCSCGRPLDILTGTVKEAS